MQSAEIRNQFLDFNIKLIQQLLNVTFEGSTLEEKEAFYAQYEEQRSSATNQILTEVYELRVAIDRALAVFPKSFINSSNEIILEPKNNIFFRLEDVENVMDFKCKMLAWLSRPIGKGLNKYWWPRVLKSFNELLGTSFSRKEMLLIYDRLGNDVNRKLSIQFIESNYDLNLLVR